MEQLYSALAIETAPMVESKNKTNLTIACKLVLFKL